MHDAMARIPYSILNGSILPTHTLKDEDVMNVVKLAIQWGKTIRNDPEWAPDTGNVRSSTIRYDSLTIPPSGKPLRGYPQALVCDSHRRRHLREAPLRPPQYRSVHLLQPRQTRHPAIIKAITIPSRPRAHLPHARVPWRTYRMDPRSLPLGQSVWISLLARLAQRIDRIPR